MPPVFHLATFSPSRSVPDRFGPHPLLLAFPSHFSPVPLIQLHALTSSLALLHCVGHSSSVSRRDPCVSRVDQRRSKGYLQVPRILASPSCFLISSRCFSLLHNRIICCDAAATIHSHARSKRGLGSISTLLLTALI